jgi:hypothetical protein
VIIRGTQTGWWRGLPPTGNRIDLPLCAIYEFDQDDKLLGERIYHDRGTSLAQLRIWREPSSLLGRLFLAWNHPLVIIRAMVNSIIRRWPSKSPGSSSGTDVK